jgi:alkanesulfonate monooxygenase SsuD/methylene tetrahydromethanopterin reductase-like flavin-dependent oxidoreductase (luciferase family)
MFGHSAEQHVTIGIAAEQLGFEDLWIGEHVVAPMQQRQGMYHGADIIRDDVELSDIWTVCGAVLAATTRLTVSPGVLIAPLRHPANTALAAVSATRIAPGRFRLGVGAGWLEEEFELIGVDFANRFGRLAEIVEIVRLLASGGEHAYDGRYYQFPAIRTTHDPTPFPIVFGGLSDAAVRRAARLGDGWYGVPGLDFDRVAEVREIVAAERAGLDGFQFHVRLSPDFSLGDVERLADLGVDRIILPWESLWKSHERHSISADAKIERLQTVADQLGLVSSAV